MYTTETFIKRAKEVHGDKYDYSKVDYINSATKVCIICPEHGEFWQTPAIHLQNHGCKKCGEYNSNYLSAANKKSSGGGRFIKLATEKHKGRFDYSKVKYVDYDTPVEIICPEHGPFYQSPKNHYKGDVCCPLCVREKSGVNTTEEFIKKAKEKFGDKYDYSKVKYVNATTKIIVTDENGVDFSITPNYFLSKEFTGKGTRKLTTEEFVDKSRLIWGDKYDYSKTVYQGYGKKITVICPVHGEVEVLPENHLNSKKFSGCPKCNTEKNLMDMEKIKKPRKTKEERRKEKENEFIEKAKQIYGNKYDYSKVHYVKSHEKVCIICPEHGEFWMRPNDHVDHMNYCPMCGKHGRRNKPYTQEEFIKFANEVFGGYYTYPRTVYKAMQKPIIVTCPEHGDFEIRAFDHVHHRCGCPEHHVKSSLELRIENMLIEKGIKYVYQKRFPWLGLQSLDFYLPDYNIGIECQGEQHFEPVESWGGKINLESNKKRDELKKELCVEHGVDLLYYTEKRFMKYLTENKEVSFFEIEKIYEKIFSKSST